MTPSPEGISGEAAARLPAVPPSEVLDVLRFVRGTYDALVDSARERGLQELLTIPPHLSAARTVLLDEMERQATRAAEAGLAAVSIELPLTVENLRVIRWYLVRRHMLENFVVERPPSDWARALRLLRDFLDAVVRATPQGWLG